MCISYFLFENYYAFVSYLEGKLKPLFTRTQNMKTEIAPFLLISDLPPAGRSTSGQFAATTMKKLTTILCLFLLGSITVFGGTEAEDAAVIKGCKEAVVVGVVSHGRNKDELKIVVTDCWRGEFKGGKVLYIKSETEDYETDEVTGFEPGSIWIVMGTEKDGMFLPKGDINYLYTDDKAHWMQVVLGILAE